IVFAKVPQEVHKITLFLMPLAVLVLIWFQLSGSFSSRAILLPITWNLGVLLLVALACHGELAQTRPSTRHLTEFYLLLSVGGVRGGLFTALLAPLLFTSLLEYQLALTGACLLLPPETSVQPQNVRRAVLLDLLVPAGLLLLSMILFSGYFKLEKILSPVWGLLDGDAPWFKQKVVPIQNRVNDIFRFVPPLTLAYLFVHLPLRF